MALRFLAALPRASGEGTMGWRTEDWAAIPASPLSSGEKPQGQWTSLCPGFLFLVCPNESTLPALRADWKD